MQVTVDIYGHLLPEASVAYVDRLDSETTPQKSASPRNWKRRGTGEG